MANAPRDDNRIPTLLAVSNVDGTTPVVLWADPTTHRLLVSSGGTFDNLSDVVLTSEAQGDILYNNGTNWVNLVAGSAGQLLTTQGGSANPTWTSIAVASPTASGVVELATAAEVTTGTDTGRAITPDALAASDFGKRIISVILSANSTVLTTGDEHGDAFITIPAEITGWSIASAQVSVASPGVGDNLEVQLRNKTQGYDILSTKIFVGGTDTSSYTSSTPAVIASPVVTKGDQIALDIDAIHSTTSPEGLTVILTMLAP